MARFKTDTIDMPAHWASYLINGDASGLDDAEQAACDAYTREHVYAHAWSIVGCSDESHFGRFAGLGTDLLTYELLRPCW